MGEINNMKEKSEHDSAIGNSEFREHDINFGIYSVNLMSFPFAMHA